MTNRKTWRACSSKHGSQPSGRRDKNSPLRGRPQLAVTVPASVHEVSPREYRSRNVPGQKIAGEFHPAHSAWALQPRLPVRCLPIMHGEPTAQSLAAIARGAKTRFEPNTPLTVRAAPRLAVESKLPQGPAPQRIQRVRRRATPFSLIPQRKCARPRRPLNCMQPQAAGQAVLPGAL